MQKVEGIDLGEIFSPFVKLTSIRLLLAIVSSFDNEVEKLDGKIMLFH